MIFNNNPTMSFTPVAEGYDCSTGSALALVESARSDYAMFEAMLKVEAQACNMESASSNYVNEAEYIALQESTMGNIFRKIAELFKALAAKVKAIFNSFVSKLTSLFASDKEMVRKYKSQVLLKSHLGKMEIKKYRKVLVSPSADSAVLECKELSTLNDDWKEDEDDRVEVYLKKVVSSTDRGSFEEDYMDVFFDTPETIELSEITGGIAKVIGYLEGIGKIRSNINTKSTKLITKLNKLVNQASKEAVDTAKATPTPSTKADDKTLEDARHKYDMAQAYQTAMLMVNRVYMDAVKIEYKQYKSIFMKAISVNDKKLEESADYAQAVAEAAEDEVTEVMDKAMSNEELSELNAASTKLLDSDVKDCPEDLVYDKVQHYTPNGKDHVDGSIDTEINSKEEAAFFGQLLY